MEDLKMVRVHGHDLSTWTTALNPKVTEDDIKAYFIGKKFNITTLREETQGIEHIVTGVKVEILNDNNETIKTLF